MSLFFSCEREKVISYDIPYDGDKLVLLAFMSAQEGITAYVTHTLPPAQQNKPAPIIEGASVKVFKDGHPLGSLLDQGAGRFVSPSEMIFLDSSQYSLVLNAPGFDDVSTPQINTIDVVALKDVEVISLNDSSNVQIAFSFLDPVDSYGNLYQVGLNRYDEQSNQLGSSDDDFFDAFGSFPDTGFDGELYTSFISTNRTFEDEYNVITPIRSVELQVFSFSPEVIKYLESTFNYEGTHLSAWYEPLPIYNNISGGYGIFGAYSVAKVRKSL